MPDEQDYEVGYKKPPKHTQFKPGQSGNPKGRPKNVRNFKTDLQAELQAHITITESGQPRQISRQQAIIKRAMEKALQGDTKSIQLVGQWVLQHLQDEETSLGAIPLSSEDEALLKRYSLDRGSEHSDREH